MTDIIIQAYHVLDEIKGDSKYIEIKALDQLICKKYEKEIENFQKAKQNYDQVMTDGGGYHPDFKEAVKQFSDTKTILYNKDEVKQYFKVEKEFQDELNTFLFELTQSVSNHIKTPDKMGIIKKGGSCHVR
ncbi:YlbF family regulator [Peloplasma aerotolerans]|uniref:YlbF family regulator n=1 Tax=Peloplasma aerotolerans TaxID=3044389 RepID=A0AAW6U4S8_9MOLU|nr:YlbF family regulator [Mariniplasma sp. M4Ah]MDI6452927.1 YlbF family regulator [Mariniplasma sp. M4Ah]MDR4968311.1 YlbF family regulator [Acholeplasmataceae bacterium]